MTYMVTRSPAKAVLLAGVSNWGVQELSFIPYMFLLRFLHLCIR